MITKTKYQQLVQLALKKTDSIIHKLRTDRVDGAQYLKIKNLIKLRDQFKEQGKKGKVAKVSQDLQMYLKSVLETAPVSSSVAIDLDNLKLGPLQQDNTAAIFFQNKKSSYRRKDLGKIDRALFYSPYDPEYYSSGGKSDKVDTYEVYSKYIYPNIRTYKARSSKLSRLKHEIESLVKTSDQSPQQAPELRREIADKKQEYRALLLDLKLQEKDLNHLLVRITGEPEGTRFDLNSVILRDEKHSTSSSEDPHTRDDTTYKTLHYTTRGQEQELEGAEIEVRELGALSDLLSPDEELGVKDFLPDELVGYYEVGEKTLKDTSRPPGISRGYFDKLLGDYLDEYELAVKEDILDKINLTKGSLSQERVKKYKKHIASLVRDLATELETALATNAKEPLTKVQGDLYEKVLTALEDDSRYTSLTADQMQKVCEEARELVIDSTIARKIAQQKLSSNMKAETTKLVSPVLADLDESLNFFYKPAEVEPQKEEVEAIQDPNQSEIERDLEEVSTLSEQPQQVEDQVDDDEYELDSENQEVNKLTTEEEDELDELLGEDFWNQLDTDMYGVQDPQVYSSREKDICGRAVRGINNNLNSEGVDLGVVAYHLATLKSTIRDRQVYESFEKRVIEKYSNLTYLPTRVASSTLNRELGRYHNV